MDIVELIGDEPPVKCRGFIRLPALMLSYKIFSSSNVVYHHRALSDHVLCSALRRDESDRLQAFSKVLLQLVFAELVCQLLLELMGFSRKGKNNASSCKAKSSAPKRNGRECLRQLHCRSFLCAQASATLARSNWDTKLCVLAIVQPSSIEDFILIWLVLVGLFLAAHGPSWEWLGGEPPTICLMLT